MCPWQISLTDIVTVLKDFNYQSKNGARNINISGISLFNKNLTILELLQLNQRNQDRTDRIIFSTMSPDLAGR